MSFTPVVVTGTWTDADDNPCQGQVTFTLTEAMTDSTDHAIVPRVPVVAMLGQRTGAISQALYANDDPTTSPGAQYEVIEDVATTEGLPVSQRTYLVTIPHAAPGGTIDLSEL